MTRAVSLRRRLARAARPAGPRAGPRATRGGAPGISPSPWLLAFSVFLFFGLAAIKRQAELIIRPGALTTESINLDARKRHAAHPFAILALKSLARR